MKRNWIRLMVLVGPALVMSSLFWEMARMNPEYGFIIEPWSIRGTETVHGWLIFSIGLAALIAGALVLWERSEDPRISLAVTGFIVVEATVIAVVFDARPVSLTVNAFWGLVIALLLGHTTFKVLKAVIGERVHLAAVAKALLWLVLAAAWYGILAATVIGSTATLSTPVAVFAAFAILGLLSATGEPRGLAASRMLIVSEAIGWTAIIVQAGALRSTLLRLQAETSGIPASYRDVQVGAGWFLAGFGMILAFVGAVSIWAARRDTMLAAMRARRQREAAEASRQEIEEALAKLQSGASA